MSVEQMKLISLFGEYENLDTCILGIIKAGCFHPENTYNATLNSKGFSAINESNPLSSRLHKITEVLNFCGINPDEKNLSSDKGTVPDGDVDQVLEKLSDDLHDLQSNREQILKDIEESKKILEALKHFKAFDIDLSEAENSKFIKVKFGKIPADGYKKLEHYVDNPYVVFQVCSEDDNSYWGLYITPADHEEEIDRIFASLFFEQLTLPCGFKSPSKTAKEYEARLEKLEVDLKENEKTIDKYYENCGNEFLPLYNYLKNQYDAFEYRHLAVKYNDKFAAMIGWVPESQMKRLTDMGDELGGYSITEVTSGSTHLGISDLTPPTKMKNKKIFRPFEFYVEIYGVPNYKEVDPTFFVAITYTLLYGIMFADLGQGLILALVGLFMWYKMKMPLGKILVPCGISGAVFGLVFGSVFGNEELLNPMYYALGFKEKPIEVMSSATTLLAFSIGIGFVLILLAMILGIVSSFKKNNIGMAIFGPNGIAGFVLYLSIVVFALSMVAGINIPTKPLIICGIIIPVVLIFFHAPFCSLFSGNGFKVESVGDFVLESIFELMETVLSYFTNTVSFLRVGAFVLIHAGMMMAFTSLSEIVGGGVAGTVMMVFGNIFVIALEGLLVGIQVLRLEFYEMFSRYYDGDGYVFNPIKMGK